MKALISLLSLCFVTSFVNAQASVSSGPTMSSNNNIGYDMNGSPMKLKTKVDVDGSPYYKSEFVESNFYGADGRAYRNVLGRFNYQTNSLSFIRSADQEDKEYTPAFRVKRVEFPAADDKSNATVFQLGFPAIGLQDENTYYQILDSGKTMLLKHTQIVESRNTINGFTSNSTTTVLSKAETYYMYSPAKGMTKISKSSDDILNALGDKKTQVDNYISQNRIKVKKEDDLVKVIQYYNSLN